MLYSLIVKDTLYIIGAGFAGLSIASDIKRKKVFGSVKAFIDDDDELIGQVIDGIPVMGPVEKAVEKIKEKGEDAAVIIAIPSAPIERIKKIHQALTKNGIKRIKILPTVSQVIDGNAHLVQAREVQAADILGRTPITVPLKESLSYLRGKRVLITGAGGSIGSELSRQLLSGGAERLYLFGHGENSIYQIDRELRLLQKEGVGEKAAIVPIIGDMKDGEYTKWIIQRTRAQVIFHCAAYKHVPLMESNSVSCIENNVFGTQNLLCAASNAGVSRFVLISTDKAVSPVSVYGASKMLCEKLVLDWAKRSEECSSFMFVRFGNVLGSRGSILPLFMEQIKNGGPVTVTSRNMERYFMTIPEACSLVLRTGGVGKNGESYLLDMGEPIKIADMAEDVIRYSGFEPYKDIDISFVGLRPGERESEPLWLAEEEPAATSYDKILRMKGMPWDSQTLKSLLDELRPICFGGGTAEEYRNAKALVSCLKKYGAIGNRDEVFK